MQAQETQTQEMQAQQTHDQQTGVNDGPTRQSQRGGWLWVSAGVLAALVLVQGAGLLDRTAHAEMSVLNSSYSLMTTDGGNDEIVVVIDSRQETLMVYRVFNRQRLELLEREDLGALFTRARTRVLGRP